MESRSVSVGDVTLETFDWGTGEPVVLVQTALTADELLPVATDPTLDAFRKVLYHRRGYAGSSPVTRPGSIVRDASDCAALLARLGIDQAHVVGLSFSGAIALQLARDTPGIVHTVTLIEPPPVHTPSADEFRAANHRLLEARRTSGPRTALDEFLSEVIGPNWRRVTEEQVPGSAAQMEADTLTFFDVDLPALLAWEFTATDAAQVDRPVLYVGASDSGPWFAEVRELILEWFPRAIDVVLDGADHAVALTHPHDVAEAITDFIAARPMVSHPT